MKPELNPALDRLWQSYLDFEAGRLRRQALPALDQFIDRLLQEEPGTWRPWALNIAREVADEAKDIPVRMPLFRRVLSPALIHGIEDKQAGCLRWLAHFGSLLHHSQAELSRLPESLRSPGGLLEEALRVDPEDRRARRHLVVIQADPPPTGRSRSRLPAPSGEGPRAMA